MCLWENSTGSLVKDRMGFEFFGFVFMYARHEALRLMHSDQKSTSRGEVWKSVRQSGTNFIKISIMTIRIFN